LALILSVAPDLTPMDAVGLLAETAIDLGQRGEDSRFGAGLVDAYAAVTAARK
jgi:hypothetical protein